MHVSIFVLLTIMMNFTMAKITRFGRFRKLHTIISQETIKPASPTPHHLKFHKLSPIDYLAFNIHMPWVFFYKNYKTGDINTLKKSLSQSLTQYYPFAGMLLAPDHIECNDEGVEFVEASIDSPLDDFIYTKDQDETLDQLIPNALGCAINKSSPRMVAVQMSHFTCGGVAVAVTVSHKAADAFTTVNFVKHWATLAIGGSPINPSFLQSSMINSKVPEYSLSRVDDKPEIKYATRRFVFPNSKLNELKNKINTMGTSPVNPTRVESLTSLLFKCLATTNSGSSQPSCLHQFVNMRGKTDANIPQLAPGNWFAVAKTKIKDCSQIELNDVITNLRKERMEIQEARQVEEVSKKFLNALMTFLDDQIQNYLFSSVCSFPFYQVDFGWGKPARVMLRSGSVDANFIVFMDTPSGDGIEATVQLEEENLIKFQKDKELHAYTYEEI